MNRAIIVGIICIYFTLPAHCAIGNKYLTGGQNKTVLVQPAPKVSGTWKGQGCCNDQNYDITFDIKQQGLTISGTLRSTLLGSTSIHYIKGSYSPTQRQFNCQDIGLEKTDKTDNTQPMPISHYDFYLLEEGTKLVGSGQVDMQSKIWYTLTSSHDSVAQSPHPLRLIRTEQFPSVAQSQATVNNTPNIAYTQPQSYNWQSGSSASSNMNTEVMSNFPQLALPQSGFPLSTVQRVNQSNALNRQGMALRDAGKLQESRALLEQACLLDPNQNSGVVHENLAITLQHEGDLDSAKTQYLIALRFAPSIPRISFNLANCYAQMGNTDQAISYLKDYLSKDPHGKFSDEAKQMLSSFQTVSKFNDNPNASDYFASATAQKIVRWPLEKQPIKVFIEPAERVQGYNQLFKQALMIAFDEWMRAVNNCLSWELVSNKEDAEIVCRWASDRSSFRQPSGCELGETYVNWLPDPNHTGEGVVTGADIALCTTSLDGKAVMTPDQMKSICLHEIGHALGLTGHSSNNTDIMFFMMKDCLLTDLSARDKATIVRLYAPTDSCQSSGTTR